ncbi:MAG: TonB-dependent receptor [bacterium]
MKKYLLFFSLLFLILYSNGTTGQGTGKLRGFVRDSLSGEALIYANVFIKEAKIGVTTNDKGYYFIPSIPVNKTYTVLFTYMGYESRSFSVSFESDKITELDVNLLTEDIVLQAFEKVGEKIIRENETDLGLQRISIKQLESLPKGVETDIFRSLQYVTGVQSTGDISARYYVRGGASNQNLVLLNGSTIYNPFHALGLFSVIDPEMINSIEFYKGGYTAEFGDRLSSVLKVITKDGNRNRFSASASSSYLTGKVSVEGPLPSGSFILTGRKSYRNEIMKKFLDEKSPPFDFYDVSYKINFSDPNFIKGSRFELHGFISNDNLDDENPTREDFNWSNNILGFKWFQVYDNPFYSEFDVSASSFQGKVIPNYSESNPRENKLEDVSLKMDFTYLWDSKDEMRVGMSIKTIKTKLYQINQRGIVTDLFDQSANFSMYVKYKLLQFESLGIDLGSRINLIGLSEGGSSILEPRASFTYQFMPQLVFKAACGSYLQELTTISDESEVISLFEPWIITPNYIKPATAVHYTFGVETKFFDNLSVDVEGYYKKIDNFPALNDEKRYDTDPDLLAGKGDSYGWEFALKYELDRLKFSAAYTLSWAYKEVNGWVYLPKYDSRHNINLSLEYNIGAGWQASVVWVYNSGLPFTQLLGYYDKLFLTNIASPIIYNQYFSPYQLLDSKNLGRLPVYHRLDLNLSKKFDFNFIRIELDFNIINAYDRKNLFYFERDTGRRVNMLPFLPTATIKVEI